MSEATIEIVLPPPVEGPDPVIVIESPTDDGELAELRAYKSSREAADLATVEALAIEALAVSEAALGTAETAVELAAVEIAVEEPEIVSEIVEEEVAEVVDDLPPKSAHWWFRENGERE